MSRTGRGDYGIDAPGVVRGLAVATAVGIGLGAAGLLAGRRDALTEIDRVLRPGRRLVVLDLARTEEYRSVLEGAGWTGIERTKPRGACSRPLAT